MPRSWWTRVFAGLLALSLGIGGTFLSTPARAAQDSPGEDASYWVQNIEAVELWSGPGADAVSFGPVGRWHFFEVIGEQQGDRVFVLDPRTGAPAWIAAEGLERVERPDDPAHPRPHPTAGGALVPREVRLGDYAIPGGEFFTQGVRDREDGTGFPVYDAHGANLLSGYVQHGGPPGIGYPTSSRFAWDGATAQAFEGGVLRWVAASGEAELRPLADLPGGQVPAHAAEPEFPPFFSAELVKKPWSGWFWPTHSAFGATLYAPGGPLEKYDRYVQNTTGASPGTQAWERVEMVFPGLRWAGHCNGWAAAALLEDEPTASIEAGGVLFSVADLKGLLSDYHFADQALWSVGEEGVLDPAEFHRVLFSWMQGEGLGFITTFDFGGGEVWNYPAYAFDTSWGPDPTTPGRWHVRTTLWMANMEVPPDFVGLQPYPGPEGKVLEYTLIGHPLDPESGTWTGASAQGPLSRPGAVWYPDPDPERRNVGPCLPGTTCLPLVHRNLDYETIGNILKGR